MLLRSSMDLTGDMGEVFAGKEKGSDMRWTLEDGLQAWEGQRQEIIHGSVKI